MVDRLSLDDFFDMLGHYGAEVGNWPITSAQLESVLAFLARSSVAREAIEEMRGIEAELRRDLPRAPAGLADRVLAAAGRPIPGRPIMAHRRARLRTLH